MKRYTQIVVVAFVALVVNLAVGFKSGLAVPMTSDAEHYLDIAKSLVAGHGYYLPHGFWPDAPTMSRSPAWPFTVSLALRCFQHASPDLIMRCLDLLLNSLVAVLVALLAKQLLSCSVAKPALRLVLRSSGSEAGSLGVAGLLSESPKVSPSSATQQLNTLSPSSVSGTTQPCTASQCEATQGQQPNNSTTILPALAGIAYALYPTPLYLAYNGASEMLFLVLTLSGTLLLLSQKQQLSSCSVAKLLSESPEVSPSSTTQQLNNLTTGAAGVCGFLLLGLACLARPNFILWIGFATLLAGFYWLKGRKSRKRVLARSREDAKGNAGFPPEAGGRISSLRAFAPSREALLLIFLFLLPSLFWAARNYSLTGHFPVFSTLRGQTFYGGNNDVVSGTHEYWGYWIFPDQIPGEPKMEELAKTKSEYGVDCYYYDKGKAWVRTHAGAMPGLILGKLVRAYVPVPWKPTKATVAVSAIRWVLYIAAIVGLVMCWRMLDARFKMVLGAMVLTNAATVMVFWGCARFAFAIEPFVLPMAMIAITRLVCRWAVPRNMMARNTEP